jgi:cobalt/nickel transport system permease protein
MLVASVGAAIEGGVVAPTLHTPDGFLSVPVALAMWLPTIIAIAIAVRRTNRSLDDRAIPLMGVLAAFVFAAQMVNFPVAPGTSGHLLGGVLAAVLVGPWVGTLVMACVVAVQALVFADGGLIVMGANIFNMGIVGTLGGYAIYRAVVHVLRGGEERARLPAAGIAAWFAVMVGAVAISLQLAISGQTVIEVIFPMVAVHALIGIGEALITVAALRFIGLTRADLFSLRDAAVPAADNAALGA